MCKIFFNKKGRKKRCLTKNLRKKEAKNCPSKIPTQCLFLSIAVWLCPSLSIFSSLPLHLLLLLLSLSLIKASNYHQGTCAAWVRSVSLFLYLCPCLCHSICKISPYTQGTCAAWVSSSHTCSAVWSSCQSKPYLAPLNLCLEDFSTNQSFFGDNSTVPIYLWSDDSRKISSSLFELDFHDVKDF